MRGPFHFFEHGFPDGAKGDIIGPGGKGAGKLLMGMGGDPQLQPGLFDGGKVCRRQILLAKMDKAGPQLNRLMPLTGW